MSSISSETRRLALLVWDYHHLRHRVRPCDAAIGLGSHDLGVATFSAELYHAGLFPVLVFTGATSPTTEAFFPRGEAVSFREHAMGLGVPAEAIVLEPRATNTGENIALSREVMTSAGITPESVLLISKPYMERRAYATARKLWPGVEFVCASEPTPFDDYLARIGDDRFVLDMMVGDLQRVIEYPRLGFAVEQEVPGEVRAAYEQLKAAGFDGHLASPDQGTAKSYR